MRALLSWLGLLGTLALAGLPAPAVAQAVGSEFQINTYTTSLQRDVSVAADASGNFVVIWSSYVQDGSSFGVFGQRYDSAGVAQGDEFRVNSYTTSDQRFPSVASDASGDFVVAWASQAQDGDDDGIFGQRYDSGGAAKGSEFRVNSYTTRDQNQPSVASDASGNFVVVWASYYQDFSDDGIFGQRYDSGGVAQGSEFRVNSYNTSAQEQPAVASDGSGNFVVVWASCCPDGDGHGIVGKRYDDGGVAQGNEFLINSYKIDTQWFPSVQFRGADQFVVGWASKGQDGDDFGVFGQRFDFGQTIAVTHPNTNVKWQIGSQRRIQWTHTLGAGETFRLELDRNNDGHYEELIAAAAPANATRGSFAWTVTGPPSATARVRVSWTDDPGVSDDVTFRITPAELDGEQ